MGSTYSQAKLLKRRVRQVQGRAKAAGIVYLLGTAMLLLCATCVLGVAGTCLHTEKSGGILLPVLTFYLPLLDAVQGRRALWAPQTVLDCIAVIAYALMVIVIAVCFLYCLSKINWLFKRRASYVNGFNRNMYAMDAMAKCYSVSFSVSVICGFVIMLASNLTVSNVNVYGYAVLGLGVAVHFVGGLISGSVTLFTSGKRIQEQVRPNGLLMHVVRNVLQIVSVTWVAYLLLKQNSVYTALLSLPNILFPADGGAIAWWRLGPIAVALAAWLGVAMMTAYACSAKEFDRDGMSAYGIQRFTTFALVVCAAVVGMTYWPLPDLAAVQSVNQDYMLAAAVAGITCLLNWILRVPTLSVEEEDEVQALLDNESKDDEDEEDDE